MEKSRLQTSIRPVDTLVPSCKLQDYELFYDGDIALDVPGLERFLLSGKELNDKVFVKEVTPEINEFNSFLDNELSTKTEMRDLDRSWRIPDEYLEIDVEKLVRDRLIEMSDGMTDNEIVERLNRINTEFTAFKQLDLIDFLKTLLFIINTLEQNNKVWGVGRGSSVSSYVLYLLGIHDIDSFRFKLNFNDFIKTNS